MSRFARRPLAAALALALAAAGLLPACGHARRPQGPDSLRLRLPHDPPTLDPALANDSSSSGVLAPIFETLVKTDPATLELRPALAVSWEVSKNGLTYVFHLRPEARFHHGRSVEAQDVVFSLTRLLRYDRPSPGAEILNPVVGATEFSTGRARTLDGIQAPDAHTVRIVLATPYTPFLSRLSTIYASVVPRDLYEDPQEEYLRHPVGSGPFRFAEWRAAQSLRLERFPDHAPQAPALAGIEFRIIEDPGAALEEYRRGGLDILDQLPPGASAGVAAEFGSQYQRWPLLASTHLLFNHAAPPLAGNARLRRALNLAVDRARLCEQLSGGLHMPASGILPPGLPGYDPSRPAYHEDLDEARRLLAEAGYPGGKGLPPLTLLYNNNPRVQQLAEQVQIDLARVGVRLDLRSADGAGFLEAASSGMLGGRPLHLIRMGWTPDYPDPDALLGVQLLSRNAGLAGNFSRYHAPDVDKLIEEARRTLDEGRRIDLYRKAERLAADRDACWLFLYFHRLELLVSPRVQGVQPVVLGDWFIPYERLSLGS